MNDCLVCNGNIWNAAGDAPFRGSLLVRNGKIAQVWKGGDFPGVEAFPGVAVVEAGGGSVIPSFTDAHVHCASYARQKLGVDLSAAASLEEAVALLRAAGKEAGPNDWIYGKGMNENNWKERRLPTKDDFEGIDQPLLIMRICCHIHVANQRALEEAGLEKFEQLEGVCRNPSREINGILEENAALPLNQAFEASLQGNPRLDEAFQHTFEEFLSWGIGEIHPIGANGIGLSEDMVVYQNYRDEGRLPLRTVIYFDSLPSLPFRSGLGDDWVAYGGHKIFLDGSLGGHTAALTEPYADDSGTGTMLYDDETLEQTIRATVERDVQLMTHVIGNAAIDQYLRVLERLQEQGVTWRFPLKATHMQVCSPGNVERVGKLGLFCDIQPHQLVSDVRMAPERLGAERSNWCFPLKSLIKAGATLVASSDCPVEPLSPLLGVRAAMLRTTRKGYPEGGWNSAEGLSLEEALSMYTINPQKLIRRDDRKGTLEEGKAGDIAVFQEDLFALDPDSLPDCTLLATIVDGRVHRTR